MPVLEDVFSHRRRLEEPVAAVPGVRMIVPSLAVMGARICRVPSGAFMPMAMFPVGEMKRLFRLPARSERDRLPLDPLYVIPPSWGAVGVENRTPASLVVGTSIERYEVPERSSTAVDAASALAPDAPLAMRRDVAASIPAKLLVERLSSGTLVLRRA